VPQKEWSYINNLREYQPDYIIHGDDWKQGSLAKIREDVFNTIREWGGEVIEIPYTQGINSSSLNKNIIAIGTTPDIRLKFLRRLIATKSIVRVLEAHSGISGLIVENVEVWDDDKRYAFDAIWSSSLTDSTSKGKPDIEAVDLTTRLHDLNDILECTTKPIIFDGDTGGKIEHFVFTVRTLERHGISAVIIEDKIGLKKNSLFGTDVVQTQDNIEDFCAKIKAGKNAQITEDFMIIARIESLICGQPIADALKRAYAYVKAGADVIMIHSKDKTGDDVKEFCLAFRNVDKTTPIVVVPTTYHHVTEDELKQWGVNIVIYANHLLRASYPAMFQVATTILKHRRASEADQMCMPIKEILELIPGTK
jgi:phosphoenolpyruvate phosphomutase